MSKTPGLIHTAQELSFSHLQWRSDARGPRDGKLVRHRLATDVVRRLGQDVLATVSR